MHTQPFDLLYVIRSDREDVNHLFAQSVRHMLAGKVELVAHIRTFRFLDGRDFNGFIYGANTAHGRFKRQVALVQDKDSFEDQGSYIHVQRVKFDLNRWQQLSLSEQEAIMGRSRLENKKLENALANNHAVFTELKSSDNLPLLLEQSMPFGDVFEQGSLWVSCAAKGHAFEELLKARVGNEQHYDAWLDYCQADMGAAFFAPSVQFLQKMAQKVEN